MISIHALREEGDRGRRRPPHPHQRFQSTPSARRATEEDARRYEVVMISIHALREEGDQQQGDSRSYENISIHALREEGDA